MCVCTLLNANLVVVGVRAHALKREKNCVPQSKVNNRAKCLAINQVIRAQLYNKLSHTYL